MATLPLFEQPAPTGTIHGNEAIIAREPSAVTLNPAKRGHFKTGHRDWPET